MPSSSDADRYEAYYADKLWRLLPEIYRSLDSVTASQKGPLQEIVDRIGAQIAIVRRSIDRTWEDQSIESCDDWVIPYIGDLLATHIVPSLDARGQRLDVARTIFYRRRKGTVAVLEQLASDITLWDARVVELFRRMARARHGLDPEIGWPADSPDPDAARQLQSSERILGPLTGTPTYGLADLRSPHGARLTGTAFDEFSYTADVRVGRDHTGWYNIPRLGVFLWRLRSFPVDAVTPVADATCAERFSLDPTGRQIPLFARSSRTYGDGWIAPAEHQLPGPISRLLSLVALDQLYAAPDAQDPTLIHPNSFGLYRESVNQTTGDITLDLIPAAELSADPADSPTKTYIDPEQGLVYLGQDIADDLTAHPEHPLRVAYCYGFSTEIGAGTYDRRVRGQAPPASTGTNITVKGGGSAVKDALGPLDGNGSITIDDSRTYDQIADVTGLTSLTVRSSNQSRPLLRLPPSSGTTTWTLDGQAGSSLTLDGILVSGGEILLTGEFDSVTIRSSTLDPGDLLPGASAYTNAVDLRQLAPCRLHVTAKINTLVIDRSITGPIWVEGSGSVESMVIQDSIVQGLGSDSAIDSLSFGAVEITRSTILGSARVHRLEASGSILHDITEVVDRQHGCVRFCAWAQGSTLPRRYESHRLPAAAPIFTSLRFGQPGYAQLSGSAPAALADGADDGSEIGAFSREKNAIKERGLRIKYQEYMPVGLTPVFIYVT